MSCVTSSPRPLNHTVCERTYHSKKVRVPSPLLGTSQPPWGKGGFGLGVPFPRGGRLLLTRSAFFFLLWGSSPFLFFFFFFFFLSSSVLLSLTQYDNKTPGTPPRVDELHDGGDGGRVRFFAVLSFLSSPYFPPFPPLRSATTAPPRL